MQSQEIKKIIEESRRAGDLAAFEEYDRTRRLPFQKEVVAFTIRRDIMEEFRKRHIKEMSGIVEQKIEELLKKERNLR